MDLIELVNLVTNGGALAVLIWRIIRADTQYSALQDRYDELVGKLLDIERQIVENGNYRQE